MLKYYGPHSSGWLCPFALFDPDKRAKRQSPIRPQIILEHSDFGYWELIELAIHTSSSVSRIRR